MEKNEYNSKERAKIALTELLDYINELNCVHNVKINFQGYINADHKIFFEKDLKDA